MDRKLIKVALMSSFVAGFFGSMPGFVRPEFPWLLILSAFIFIFFYALLLWTLHILLSGKVSRLKRFYATSVMGILLSYVFLLAARYIDHLFHLVPPLPPAMNGIGNEHFFLLPLSQGLGINTFIFVIMEMFLLQQSRNIVARENEELRVANMEAKISILKSQIQPHFLFNSLSTLHSLIQRSPDRATQYLLQLSDMLRFSIVNTKPMITVNEDLELCLNYLNMQKVRFGEALSYRVSFVSEGNQLMIPVYSLQQLAENAIKHNILTREQPLHIDIAIDANLGHVLVSNNLQLKENIVNRTGTGLDNLNERFRLLGFSTISVMKDIQKFAVTLKLKKDGRNHH